MFTLNTTSLSKSTHRILSIYIIDCDKDYNILDKLSSEITIEPESNYFYETIWGGMNNYHLW